MSWSTKEGNTGLERQESGKIMTLGEPTATNNNILFTNPAYTFPKTNHDSSTTSILKCNMNFQEKLKEQLKTHP